MKVQIINNSINELPKYANPGDAGLDLMADFSKGLNSKFMFFADYDDVSNEVIIFSGGRALIPTNLHVAIPEGYELQVRPRSGLALKHGITLTNCIGTIDEGYRNSIGAIVMNLGEEPFSIAQGDRICQAVLNKFETIEWDLVEVLSESQRNLNGFGSSGVK